MPIRKTSAASEYHPKRHQKKQHCSIVLPSVTDNALCLHGSMGGPSIFRAHPNPPTHHQSTSHRFLLPPKQPGLARAAAFLSYQLQFAFIAPNPNALAQLMDVNFARTSAFCPWQSVSIRAGALLQGMAIPCSLPPFYMEGFFVAGSFVHEQQAWEWRSSSKQRHRS